VRHPGRPGSMKPRSTVDLEIEGIGKLGNRFASANT
jgi:hypothetical protein